MENNEIEQKPQTGGLKLMTVFVFVLALHVVVIGGMTAYYVFRSNTGETETMADKTTGIKGANLPGETATPEVADKPTGVYNITPETLASTQSNAAPVEAAAPATEPAPVTPAAPAEQPVVAETPAPAVTPEVTPAPATEPVKNEVAATPEAIPAPAPPVVPVAPVAPVEFAATPAVVTPPPAVSPTPANLLPPPEPAKKGTSDAPRLVANGTKSTLTIPDHPAVTPASATSQAPSPVTVKSTPQEAAKTTTASASKFVTIPVSSQESAPKKSTSEKKTSEKITYTVKAHDTLEKVAHKNDTTVARLREANNLNSDLLSAGQKLIIPVKFHNTAIASTTTKAAKTTEKSVAKTADKTTDKTTKVATTSAKSTVTKTAAKTSVASTGTSKAKTYTVVKGDTLIKIAHEYKTTPKALMAANGISDPKKLSIGKQLTIPAVTKSATAKVKTTQLANNEQ